MPSTLVSCRPRRPGRKSDRLGFVEEPYTGTVWPAHIVELSARGARLLAHRHWEVATVLSVELLGPDTTQNHTATLRVTRAGKNEAGLLIVCGVFQRPVPQEVLRSVLGCPQESGSGFDPGIRHEAPEPRFGP